MKTPSARFNAKVERTAECWVWRGAANRKGYGNFWTGTRLQVAHRFAYEQAYGPIPEGQLVCHHCDTPSCVRPSHLFLGTYKDNAADMKRKDRSNRGERHGLTHLNVIDVSEILWRYRQGQFQREIAEQFGISQTSVGRIVRGETWATHPYLAHFSLDRDIAEKGR